MFFWWICGGESGLPVLFLCHLQFILILNYFDAQVTPDLSNENPFDMFHQYSEHFLTFCQWFYQVYLLFSMSQFWNQLFHTRNPPPFFSGQMFYKPIRNLGIVIATRICLLLYIYAFNSYPVTQDSSTTFPIPFYSSFFSQWVMWSSKASINKSIFICYLYFLNPAI